MSDLIKREDAITVLYRNTPFDANGIALLDKCESEINTIPSAQPKQGHWEMCEDDDGIYGVCSECGQDADFSHYGKSFDFCPNCGARMTERSE